MIKFHLNLHIIHLKYISKMAKQQKLSKNKMESEIPFKKRKLKMSLFE